MSRLGYCEVLIEDVEHLLQLLLVLEENSESLFEISALVESLVYSALIGERLFDFHDAITLFADLDQRVMSLIADREDDLERSLD